MSRPYDNYQRDRRSPPRWGSQDRLQDRRTSGYNDARGGRRQELRDAPPLGGRPPYRDPRDFSPRDERRDSRDAPPPGPGYSDPPPFRGGYRGRGRGDDFRGRGGRGRYPDERDLFPRDLSRDRDRSPPPPPRYYRNERSPDRHDDRPYPRRDDNRWQDREREMERRRPDLSRIDSRPLDTPASAGPSPATSVNPDRLALIEDANAELRRPPLNSMPSAGRDIRREPDAHPPLNSRAENASVRYGSRASSPPTQPPAVPAFGLSFAPAAPAAPVRPASDSKPADEPRPAERAPEGPAPARANLQAAKSNESLGPVAAPPTQPRAAASPVVQSRAPPPTAPTGPRADRPTSRSSTSPRVPFSALNRDQSAVQVRPRSPPPPTAPLGPRGHGTSISPEMAFAAAPTAPRAERQSMNRGQDRPFVPRMQDRGSMPISRQPGAVPPPKTTWNSWRRSEQDIRPEQRVEQRPQERPVERRPSTTQREDKMDVDTAQAKAPSASGHSAQQSFFGKPTDELEDDEDDIDPMDDSFGASDEDDNEADLALFEAKFERQRRELESRLVDLSAQQYRATTPLENIARLARITMKDVERFRERGAEMDVDEPQAAEEQSVPPATHSSASEEAADVMTPKGEDDNSVLIHDAEDDEAEDIIRRIRRPTPETITLPFLTKSARPSLDDVKPGLLDDSILGSIEDNLMQERAAIKHEGEDLELRFAQLYRAWREECQYLDADREVREKEAERQASYEPAHDAEQPVPANPIAEGRGRLHKFSSEWELAQVMKESEELARQELERTERAAVKDQADLEKEATVPDQLSRQELQRSMFIDSNRLREPETLTMVFSYEPPIDDFTENEQQIFIAAFKETPKKWSEIASLLPGREPKDCIRHYYANKWDDRFKDNNRKRRQQGKKGKGAKATRGKGSAMQDLKMGDGLGDGPVVMSDSGRPKRAAAPVSFGERESEAKALMSGVSPAKRAGPAGAQADGEKPAKRRRAVGEKAVRKAKGAPALASLAAAPGLSPDGRPLPASKDIDRSRLEEASLLTAFHAGRPPLQVEPPMVFTADQGYMHRPIDSTRMQPALQGGSAKPSPSSYWSVPEQQDFDKYIKHFGTDFTAIAQHMGTKTHTMIKNHYQRQIDGGKRELEANAMAANARRERGEDIGAPPIPTPITKRKYDQPPTTTQRSLVPMGEPMEIDDGIGARSSMKQHGSPPQFAMQPRYSHPVTTSAVQPGRIGEPLGTPSFANTKPYQPRASIYADPRAPARPSIGSTSTFMGAQAASGRSVQEASNPEFIQSLLDEQKRAQRLQEGYQERPDPYHHRPSLQVTSQQSPLAQSALLHGERKSVVDQRSMSPPVGFFRSTSGSRPFDTIRHNYAATVPSPPKREISATVPYPAAPPPAEPPKRSNVMSLLNDTPEEPKPKRTSLDLAPPPLHRHASPPHAPAYQPRDPYAPSLSQSQFSRSGTGPAVSSSLKQEPLSATSIQSAVPKQDWPRAHGTLTPPSTVPYGRDRQYYPHHATMLGQLGTPNRANPSPPPHASLQHSRTPSMAAVEPQRSAYTPATAASSLFHPPAYSQPPATSQAPAHDHASSLSTGYPPPHSRMSSRDERPSQYYADRDQRERADREWRWKQEDEAAAKRRAEQRYEQDRAYQRPMQTQGSYPYDQATSRPEGGMSMREQAYREAQLFTQHEEERVRSSTNFREREREQEEARRRHDDAFMSGAARRTPLGGAFGGPLPQRRP